MSRYSGSGTKVPSTGKLFHRIATAKYIPTVSEDKKEFERGYKEGRLTLAHANQFMHMNPAGLGQYVEAANQTVWSADGDYIVRQAVDLDWVDELLNAKESK